MDATARSASTGAAPRRALPVAVVGIGCIVPGAAGARAFWSLLRQGGCAIGPVPRERWDPATLPPSAAAQAGFVADADCFDAGFFGISPKEAAALDPRQRLALQVAWWALEDAGLAPDSLRGSDTGVFVGAVNGEYAGAFASPSEVEPHLGVGLSNAVIANRISHVLGLHGPSMALDTACSSSLVAVHQACRSLQAGDCGVALAGGVGLMLSPLAVTALGQAGMLAPDGRCKAFDANADGYGRGEGCVLFVLRRLDDALAAGDRIHAVLRGSAANHDGLSNGITAPNGLSQERLMRAALADAGVDPAAVGYVEAHGTGTLLGDPTEARALGRVYGSGCGRTAPLPIGSVKTNIGHLEAAAGAAGLAKLVLAVEHGTIPATLHYRRPNPHIDFGALALRPAAASTRWPATGPRVGAVSSFGFGGATAHAIVEQAPSRESLPAAPAVGHDPLLLSAASPDALRTLAADTAAAVREVSDGDWAAVVALSQHGRSHLRHRLAVVAADGAQAAASLDAFAAGRAAPDAVAGVAARRVPRIAFLCPGQGAQRPGMARELLAREPLFRQAIEQADDALGWSLTALLRDASADIDSTAFTQPALLAVGVALARVLAARGVQPQLLAGHSLGEYTAAVLAGALAYEDALRLVAARGRLMAALPAGGAMAAVLAPEAQVLPLLDERVAVAAVNGPQSLTISGAAHAVAQAGARLEAAGLRVRTLRVATAFHSPLIEPMLDEFGELAAHIAWQPLLVPLVSNVTGELLPVGHRFDAGYWRRHTREAVRFAAGAQALVAEGVDTTVELGLLPVLTGLLADNAPQVRAITALAAGVDDVTALARTVGTLHVQGARIAWPRSRREAAPGDALPAYPFAKDRYPLHIGAAPFGGGAVAAASPPAAHEIAAAAETSIEAAPGRDAVRARLVALVAGLLGIAPSRLDPAAPFLELGADSLILIQAVGRIEAEFGTRIPVRAFFEELTNIEALSDALVRAGRSAVAPRAAPATQGVAVEAPAPVRPVAREPAAPAATGLSDTQRRHLEQLSSVYVARTGASRAQAQRFRPVLADSRGSAGFRFSTKEMLYPIVGRRASGARVWDADGNEYIDISMGFGVQLFGHEPPFVREAIDESLARGLRIGPQSDAAGEVAELIAELTGVERVAFCSSGTEAVMTALRLARTATGRRRIAIFRDSYHGHFDGVLGDAAPGDPWHAAPRVAGIAPSMVADLAVFEYGSAASLEQLRPRLAEFAAVLVEPVQSRNPALQPAVFLQALRALTRAAGTVLVFDEVLTGFRIGAGGAQAHFGVRADLVTYGKIVGGGLPIGVVAGRGELLAGIDGGTWQYGDASFPAAETTFFAGTFNKHPLAMAAARAVLREIRRLGPGAYTDLNRRSAALTTQLDEVLAGAGAPIRMARFGSLFRFVFRENLDPFFYHLLHRGLYVWEGRNLFLSTAHTDADVAAIVERVADSVAALREGGFFAPEPARQAVAEPSVLELPLAPAQRQLAALAALSPAGGAAYTVAAALECRGQLDHVRLARAFDALVRRHGALRAALDHQAGVQRVAAEASLAVQCVTAHEDELPALLARELALPFDLAVPPALRARVFELGPERAVLLVAAHHALVDGQSLQVLLEELAALYGGETLATAPDYAPLAQRVATAGSAPDDEVHRRFWQETLRGAPAGIELPGARLRPNVRGFAGARVAADLDRSLLRRLEAKAGELGLSSTLALTAAFAAALRRCGAPGDLVLGLPFAARDEALARAVGYCAHLLPLRLQLAADATGTQAMRQVRQRFLDAIEHASYPLARILDDLQVPRDLARPPLVGITFNADRVAALPMLSGVRLAPWPLPLVHARFDIGCNLLDWQDGARIELDYDSDLYPADAMTALLHAFVALIERFGRDPEAPFDERATLHRRWDTRLAPAAGTALLQRFRRAARERPMEAAAQVDREPPVTREALDRWSDRLADAIDACAQGDGPVALLLERTVAMPAAMLAGWKAARAWLPLEPDLPAERLALLLRRAAPCCVIAEPGLAARLAKDVAVPLLAVPPLPQEARPPRPLPEPAPHAVAYQLFTSGSTGEPKLVAVPHGALVHYLDGVIEALTLAEGLRCAIVSTFAADLGLTAVLPALFHGGCLQIASAALARDAEGMASLLREAPSDLLKIVPSHLEALLAAARPRDLLPRTHLVLGGEAARAGLLEALAALQPACRVFNHFGPTETTVGVMIGEWDGGPGPIRFQQPIGAARIALLDEHDRRCGFDEPSEVVIAGPCLAAGYLGASDQGGFVTLDLGRGAERVYRSGDLARLHGDGRIELLGRRDDQVKIRGHRIEPAEIVAALTRDARIRSAAVVPHASAAGRACLVAYVVPADAEGIDAAALIATLRHSLPEAMVPAAIVVLSALPLTANGKLDRAALPAPGLPEAPADASNDAHDPVQALLLPLWRSLLRRPDIGPSHDFFASGGDSILAIQLIAKLHQAGWRATAADLYASPALAGFAQRVRPALAGDAPPAQGDCPLLPSQWRLLERAGHWPAHFNLSVSLLPAPWVTPALLAVALRALVEHHDALRLRFAGTRATFADAVSPAVTVVAQRESATDALAHMQSSLSPPDGRLLAAAWIEAGATGPAHVVIAVHHLVCDGVSLQILLEDLRQALLDARAGRTPTLGRRTSSVQDWAAALQRVARHEATAAEAPFWHLTATLPPPALPRTAADRADPADVDASELVTLSAAQTAHLLHPGREGVGVEDLLLAAATLALAEWTGERAACFELEGHGRETARIADSDLNLARTVGWFTSRCPAWIDLEGVAADAAGQAVAQQRRAIPGRGFGHGLLRFLGSDAQRATLAAAPPPVSFNYLGRMQAPAGDAFTVASWLPGDAARGPERAENLQAQHEIAIEAAITGDCLQVVWQFDARRHGRAAVAQLAQSFLRHLAVVAAPPGTATSSGSDPAPAETKAWP